MSETLSVDEIVLKVPASAAYARIVRVGAAAVALRLGMSFSEIDELRAAIDAATDLLLEQPAADDAAIVCVFRTYGGCLEVEARRTDRVRIAATAAARFKKAVGTSNVTATVESDQGRLLLRMDIGRRGNQPSVTVPQPVERASNPA